jgi:hypothetical protein
VVGAPPKDHSDRYINQSINQSINPSIDPSIHPPIHPPTHPSKNAPFPFPSSHAPSKFIRKIWRGPTPVPKSTVRKSEAAG